MRALENEDRVLFEQFVRAVAHKGDNVNNGVLVFGEGAGLAILDGRARVPAEGRAAMAARKDLVASAVAERDGAGRGADKGAWAVVRAMAGAGVVAGGARRGTRVATGAVRARLEAREATWRAWEGWVVWMGAEMAAEEEVVAKRGGERHGGRG